MKYLSFFVAAATILSAQTVRFETNLGNIDVELLSNDAPATVENFLRYVNRGAYNNSFFHRSVRGFVIQGGGYTFVNGQPREIPADPPVRNEFKVSNTRGTIAMAKPGDNPNSATNQWFFNLADNSGNLDRQNGGFTVFGQIKDAAGLAVMDRIGTVPIYNAGSPFDSIPLQNVSGTTITADNLVVVRSITVLENVPQIRQENGILSAVAYGGSSVAAAGSYIEIYGSNLAGTTRTWNESDFREGRAPTSLDGVSVTVGGQPAYVYYISPEQVNVQIPGGVASSESVPVVVTYNGRSSEPRSLRIEAASGGILAPPAFKVADKQYAAAVHNPSRGLVSNGSIPDVPAAPAKPGDTLTFYGIGFGAVTPGVEPGQTASGETSVMGRVEFYFGDIPAQVTYSGLAPGSVGLYQFNVVVPAGVNTGDVQVRVVSGGEPIEQTLWIPVQTGGN